MELLRYCWHLRELNKMQNYLMRSQVNGRISKHQVLCLYGCFQGLVRKGVPRANTLFHTEKILSWQRIIRKAMRWDDEIKWAISYATGKSAKAQVYKTTLAGTIYTIWQEKKPANLSKQKEMQEKP